MKLSEPSKGFEALYKTVGIDGALALCRKFGGQRKYIPKLMTGVKSKRDARIYEQHILLHYSTKQLSYRWGLTQRRIQQILKRQAELTQQRCS